MVCLQLNTQKLNIDCGIPLWQPHPSYPLWGMWFYVLNWRGKKKLPLKLQNLVLRGGYSSLWKPPPDPSCYFIRAMQCSKGLAGTQESNGDTQREEQAFACSFAGVAGVYLEIDRDVRSRTVVGRPLPIVIRERVAMHTVSPVYMSFLGLCLK